MFPVTSEDNGGQNDVEASAQVIYAIGWSPHASQQKPEKRGSATHRVGDMVTEHKGDDSF